MTVGGPCVRVDRVVSQGVGRLPRLSAATPPPKTLARGPPKRRPRLPLQGGPAEGEGQETGGCPVYSHPAQLTDNRNCVLCMTCLKACPHRSIEVRLRPPGIDL